MTSPDSRKKPVDAGDPVTDAALPAAMTGRASPAKAAVGDKPVFAYISGLPQPQRSIAERVDALAAETLPNLQRSVKWGMAWYGVGDGWCFSCGGFAGHVKLTFGRGTSLTPVPPVTPIGMGKDSRGVDLESIDDMDERQLESALGEDTIEQLTNQTGLSRADLLNRLKSVLPNAVDNLTPEGRLPTDEEASRWAKA